MSHVINNRRKKIMHILFPLALVLIFAQLYWNVKRVRARFGQLKQNDRKHAHSEALMSQITKQRDRLKSLKGQYFEAAQLTENAERSARWAAVDYIMAQSVQNLLQLNFAGALASTNNAVLKAESLVAPRQ
jgi:hypothetical protein